MLSFSHGYVPFHDLNSSFKRSTIDPVSSAAVGEEEEVEESPYIYEYSGGLIKQRSKCSISFLPCCPLRSRGGKVYNW